MNVFTSSGIAILSMLILSILQLTPGVFMLFYHSALGKFSQKKASLLSIFFILGAGTLNICVLTACFFLLHAFSVIQPCHQLANGQLLAWVSAGVLLALALASFFLYYRRRSSGSELFISRASAKNLQHCAESTKTRSDAFLLGFFAGTYELIFTIPLYILSILSVLNFGFYHQFINYAFLVLLFFFIPLIPLFAIYRLFRSGYNLADAIKFRIKYKPFIRFAISLNYFIIAILILLP